MPAEGAVVQVNRKPETPGQRGLPKIPAPEIYLRVSGVEGDFNRFRHEERHDSPDMALLVVPQEILEDLGREGWPVQPGDLGENVTTAGIPNDAFRVGQQLRVGEALVEVAKPCDPCDNLYGLPYVGVVRGPAFLKTMLGRRGWYCRVIEEGTVRPGDAVRFVPR
jgi:MOSC domain-containing protein YiiM